MVTGSTFHRQPFLHSPERLNLVTSQLFQSASQYGWTLLAWAVLSNHYHLIAQSPPHSANSLHPWLKSLHRNTASSLNRLDDTQSRRVWNNYHDTLITRQPALMARLRYVNENPVHHRLVQNAHDYPWCSAAWFAASTSKSFQASVARFKTDTINVPDDFDGY
jgi:putative transposase